MGVFADNLEELYDRLYSTKRASLELRSRMAREQLFHRFVNGIVRRVHEHNRDQPVRVESISAARV